MRLIYPAPPAAERPGRAPALLFFLMLVVVALPAVFPDLVLGCRP
jgi:hypothetical protein